jgi:hypothetical protein
VGVDHAGIPAHAAGGKPQAASIASEVISGLIMPGLDQPTQCTAGQRVLHIITINTMAASSPSTCLASHSEVAHTQLNARIVLKGLVIEAEGRSDGTVSNRLLAGWEDALFRRARSG